IGASEAPKSTVLLTICLIPSPDPTAEYLTVVPPPDSNPATQLVSSGATKVDPAPVRLAEARAATARARMPTSPKAESSNLLRIKTSSFRSSQALSRPHEEVQATQE